MTLQPSDVGRRVVVRYRLAASVDGARATDVLGELLDWSGGRLSVRTKAGAVVDVPEPDVLAAKVVPARAETGRVGGWLLRAAGGFTGRANSCLPLADPGMPVDVAIGLVEKWYRARSLVPAFQVPAPLGTTLEAALDQRGWPQPNEDVLVLTAELADVAASTRGDLPPVELAPEPDDSWLAAYHYRGSTPPPNAKSVLVNADVPTFAAVVVDGRSVAIARGAVSDSPEGRRWLGITAVEVDPALRRRGLASHVVTALAEWARRHGATDGYLQVSDGNAGAIAMYERLGFTEHHRYHYRRLP
jgi:ribosomal protein S18 acetylase RimI-like enzyme